MVYQSLYRLLFFPLHPPSPTRQRFLMSRLKLNIHRIKVVFGIFKLLKAWMPYVQSWEDPMHSTLVIIGISSSAFFPNVVIPMTLLYLVV